jgi:uncharacterized lipoprotein NlpE involved in copper resistance
MRKTFTAIAVILALSLCGCAATQQDALEAEAGITAEADTVASYSSSEPVNSESSAFVTTAEESRDESETVSTAEVAEELESEPEKTTPPEHSSGATETLATSYSD